MPINIKRSGAWVPVPDGKVSIKSGGIWRSPQAIYVKRGGYWVNTGYLPRPGAPGAPQVAFTFYDGAYAQASMRAASPPALPVFDQVLLNTHDSEMNFLSQQNMVFNGTNWQCETALTTGEDYYFVAYALNTANGLYSLGSAASYYYFVPYPVS